MDAMLLKVPDVVACLGVSRAKVYELMASGELPSVRVGGSRRIRACDLERFVTGLDANWRKAERAVPHSPQSVSSRAGH